MRHTQPLAPHETRFTSLSGTAEGGRFSRNINLFTKYPTLASFSSYGWKKTMCWPGNKHFAVPSLWLLMMYLTIVCRSRNTWHVISDCVTWCQDNLGSITWSLQCTSTLFLQRKKINICLKDPTLFCIYWPLINFSTNFSQASYQSSSPSVGTSGLACFTIEMPERLFGTRVPEHQFPIVAGRGESVRSSERHALNVVLMFLGREKSPQLGFS